MGIVFEVIDKKGRRVYLSDEIGGEHIKLEHQEIEIEQIKEGVEKPDSVAEVKEKVFNYYKYFKHIKSKSKHLKIIVKYLNGEGFIITAYYIRDIKK
jgi:hypothetical protein